MGKTIYDPKQDERFQHPVIDQDEWRERHLPGGETIPFRYLHGYFEGTDVKFSFCFPPADRYEGRFQHYLSPFPGPDEEVASLGHTGTEDRIGFALRCLRRRLRRLGAAGSHGHSHPGACRGFGPAGRL